jgi:hypothetical protein
LRYKARQHLLDPLTEPRPVDGAGPGTRSGSTSRPNTSAGSSQITTETTGTIRSRPASGSCPTPPKSTSPRQSQSTHRHGAFAGYDDVSRRSSMERPSTEIPTSTVASTDGEESTGGRRRGNSLTSRFPGDMSHRPLDMIRRETRAAHRSPHLRRDHLVGKDTIDRLDNINGGYHHDGPYDATLLARNRSVKGSPVEAVSKTNEEALKATPREMILDSIMRHRPLDGVAMVPPGERGPDGQVLDYEEGANLMVEAGFKRWPGQASHHHAPLILQVGSIGAGFAPQKHILWFWMCQQDPTRLGPLWLYENAPTDLFCRNTCPRISRARANPLTRSKRR